jgi:4'-phosphopantetheinyl transferase
LISGAATNPDAEASAADRASAWAPPPEIVRARSDEVHVWRARLDVETHRITQLFDTLSADERQRAEAFVFPTDRDRFVAARGLLRAILSRYLACRPGLVRFKHGPSGKPALEADPAPEGLRFNLAHAGALALVAVTRGREVGIDVETAAAACAAADSATRLLSIREQAELETLPTEQRAAAFLRCWTLKEAYLKARGDGLGFGLDRFTVSLTGPAALVHLEAEPEAARWSLRELDPGPGYGGAVAGAGHDWRLVCFDLAA